MAGGRKSVEPGLAGSLTSRNHLLDDMFSARVIKVEEKKKKSDDDSDIEDGPDDDGVHYIDRVGVRIKNKALCILKL